MVHHSVRVPFDHASRVFSGRMRRPVVWPHHTQRAKLSLVEICGACVDGRGRKLRQRVAAIGAAWLAAHSAGAARDADTDGVVCHPPVRAVQMAALRWHVPHQYVAVFMPPQGAAITRVLPLPTVGAAVLVAGAPLFDMRAPSASQLGWMAVLVAALFIPDFMCVPLGALPRQLVCSPWLAATLKSGSRSTT